MSSNKKHRSFVSIKSKQVRKIRPILSNWVHGMNTSIIGGKCHKYHWREMPQVSLAGNATSIIGGKCHKYHWREMPQVSLAGNATSIIGGKCHKYHFFGSTKYFCRDNIFPESIHVFFFREKSMFLATKVLSQERFVATNICGDKHNFVLTKVLSRQAYFCRDKRRVLS